MYELLNFSYDNRYYLFFNRKDIKLQLFELVVITDKSKEE